MAVSVRIPGPLRTYTSGKAEVELEASNIKTLLAQMQGSHRELFGRICEADGSLRRFVNVYVNDEDIRFLSNLDTPLKPGDQVSIIPAIAGG
jgi:molybdopterin synthase sulfur carrier subunit